MKVTVKRICYPTGEDSWYYNESNKIGNKEAQVLILTHDLDNVRIIKEHSTYPELEYYKKDE